MATEFIPYSPVGGINSELPSDSIQDSQVQDARNFIFSRGRTITRGGVFARDGAAGSMSGTLIGASYATSPQAGGLYFFTQGAGPVYKLYRYVGADIYTEVTGAGIPGRPTTRGIVINANILWPTGNTTNMIRITTGDTYTTVNHHARYIVGHGARCLSGYADSYPNRVSWSVVGDETDWITVPGSGHTDLSDSSSWITGLGLINEVVVICRADGFHFGYPTGTVAMPYRFENRSKEGIGALWGVAFYDDLLFFTNTQDVFMLTKDGLKAIGGGMRHEIAREINSTIAANQAIYYEGLVTSHFSGELGPWYHLAPSFPPVGVARWPFGKRRAPHFAYNMREDKWQKFYYPGVFGGIFASYHAAFSGDDGVVDLGIGGEGLQQWYHVNPAITLEEEAFFHGKTLLIGGPAKDMRLRRMMLRYRDNGPSEVRVQCEADLNDTRWGAEEKVAIGDLCSGKWKRKWINMELSGNDYEYRVTVPPGNHLETNLIGGMYEPISDYQGA